MKNIIYQATLTGFLVTLEKLLTCNTVHTSQLFFFSFCLHVTFTYNVETRQQISSGTKLSVYSTIFINGEFVKFLVTSKNCNFSKIQALTFDQVKSCLHLKINTNC